VHRPRALNEFVKSAASKCPRAIASREASITCLRRPPCETVHHGSAARASRKRAASAMAGSAITASPNQLGATMMIDYPCRPGTVDMQVSSPAYTTEPADHRTAASAYENRAAANQPGRRP
jgi:hypothetical protein